MRATHTAAQDSLTFRKHIFPSKFYINKVLSCNGFVIEITLGAVNEGM